MNKIFLCFFLFFFNDSDDTERKLVTRSYGIFPKGWFFIRSKCDKTLLITIAAEKKGAKLILSKLDSRLFRRQLWRYRDDGCIVNMESDYVIDVAGGKLASKSNIIQWSPKFLRSSRKNQMWGLSVEGHIHPQSRSDLVLSSVGDHAREGAELKLITRGNLALDYQQFSFAIPVFGKCIHTTYAAQQANKNSLVLEKISDANIDVSSSDHYERITKRTVVRRWAVFPEGGFFIRSSHGGKNLALTVERDEVTLKYRIVVRTLNFKSYKWQLWRYQDGYLVNEETGLALDAQEAEDDVIEGAQAQVYLNEKASHEGQFWDLGVNGEIHLRSNERLAIGATSSEKASVEGALVGINHVRIVKTNVGEKQSVTVKSEQWCRWTFSSPVFGKRTATTAGSQESLDIEGVEEKKLVVEENDEANEDDSDSEDEEEEEYEEEEEQDDEDDLQIETPIQTPSSSTTTASTGAAIVGAGIVAGAIASETETKKTTETASAPGSPTMKKSNSNKAIRLTRKDSFQLDDDYIPSGFEKVVRYKNHHNSFPQGYFLIKSTLHGYVLDVVGDVRDGCNVVLTHIKTTDFASQLWSFRDGFLINLKGDKLVLDAAQTDSIISGERVRLCARDTTLEHPADQTWEINSEGYIYLVTKRSIVLGVKQTKRSDAFNQIDVFVQEPKGVQNKTARPEQRWEILVPGLIPDKQGESGVKIIESGKVDTVTSSASAVISYGWIKETYCHKVTAQNQWPGADSWFFIRFGSQNHFLASGETAQNQVGLYELDETMDYKRFLWIYIDGYLINYKYMLRLILCTKSKFKKNKHGAKFQNILITLFI